MHRRLVVAIVLGLAFASCREATLLTELPAAGRALLPNEAIPQAKHIRQLSSGRVDVAFLDAVNLALTGANAGVRLAMAETITHAGSETAGTTVLASNVGNKRLAFDFVPNDSRRTWRGPNGALTYAIDRTDDAMPFAGGLSAAQTDAAIERAVATWNDLTCSSLGLVRNPDNGADLGLVAFQFTGGVTGGPLVVADIQHAGWRDLEFSSGILGVTFTFTFIDDEGNPTDLDRNGRGDVAFREIYYDPLAGPNLRVWADDGVMNIDVESVAVHEFGHGLSQAHFGSIQIKHDGRIQASPRAVMNALYSAPFRALVGSDVAGHCGNWAAWPGTDEQ